MTRTAVGVDQVLADLASPSVRPAGNVRAAVRDPALEDLQRHEINAEKSLRDMVARRILIGMTEGLGGKPAAAKRRAKPAAGRSKPNAAKRVTVKPVKRKVTTKRAAKKPGRKSR